MRRVISVLFGLFGLLILVYAFLFAGLQDADRITGQVESKSVEQVNNQSNKFIYNAAVKNNYPFKIRLCGGQLNWCGASGCFSVKTEFPLYLEANQQTTITVQVSPRAETIQETELILYADGEGLNGLTPIKIKLPAMSKTSL